MKAVELKQISFSYENKKKIFEDAFFDMNYGEISILSGFSGEGKSTLFNLINGIIPNSIYGSISGDRFINGKNIKDYTISTISHEVGSVLQNADAQIIQNHVETEIAFACENFSVEREEIKKRIADSCKKMDLDPLWETRVLSGGQKQRLITAASLASQQKILMLDEPLANLDHEGAILLMKELRILADKGYAILVIEHRLNLLMDFIDRLWKLEKKKIIEVTDFKPYLNSHSFKIEDTSNFRKTGIELFCLENIGFKTKKRDILSNISFSIEKGERLLILGDNGCGKTTLLKIISRLLKPTDGIVRQGLDSKFGCKKKGSRKWFGRVGVVYQDPNYQLFMPSVREEISFKQYSKEYSDRLISLFEIEPLLERHSHSLSEGEKRIISIVAVLATKPEVLILDEPTVGQDYDRLSKLVSILNLIHNEQQITMITVTHDFRCAEAFCDTAIWIDSNKVKAKGKKELVREYFRGF